MNNYDVVVIGGGPAGLAAALAADKQGAKTLLVEREAKLGGILKQCIHDGFGLVRYNEKFSGPEYAHRFTSELTNSNVEISTLTFVSKIEKSKSPVPDPQSPIPSPFSLFNLTLINKTGLKKIETKAIILACGCRERTSRQIGIHGRHSAGVFTAGTAQYYTNILGKMPTKRCVILGSGDIGLIMARRLKLEGAEVLGVYEAKPTASGLMRNVYQCLEDFDIPLHTNKTVTRIFGEGRLSAVEISAVNENMTPISGTEQIIECDALILSVGLIPENELAETLDVPLDRKTKGPVTDQNYMTMIDGVFCCGNALHVNDLVDYVSESGETAGLAAGQWAASQRAAALQATAQQAAGVSHTERTFADVSADDSLLYIVPQKINVNELDTPAVFYFRSSKEMGKTRLSVTFDGNEILSKTYPRLRPPEMERLEIDFKTMNVQRGSVINFILSESL